VCPEHGTGATLVLPFCPRIILPPLLEIDVISLAKFHASIGAYSTGEFDKSIKKLWVLINVAHDLENRNITPVT